MLAFVLLALGIAANGVANAQLQFRVIKEWRYVNYTWRTDEELRTATATGSYNPEKCIMTGLGYYNGHYYVATPRMYDGTPATLSRIPEDGSTAPLLEPFPSWRLNRIGDCASLQNVQNIQVDADGFLYVIDSGRTNTMVPHRSNNLCAAKLVKYDLKVQDGENMAKEVYRYEFPEKIAPAAGNLLYDLVLDDHYVYISDNSAQDPGLIVFSELQKMSWKIRHGTFRADRNATLFNVTGTVITPELNLAGLALGPEMQGGRLLYYAPLSSYNLFAVNTNDLKSPTMMTLKNVRNIARKTSQSDGMTTDDRGVLYFGQLSTSSIVKWDTNKSSSYRPKLIAQDPTYVQWPSSFAFNAAGDLVVLCSTFAKFVTGGADLNEPNFRLLAGNVGTRSYVQNRFKYDENVQHVHFHPADGQTTRGTEPRMGAEDVNDLLIHNDVVPVAGAAGVSSGWEFGTLVGACMLMLQV